MKRFNNFCRRYADEERNFSTTIDCGLQECKVTEYQSFSDDRPNNTWISYFQPSEILSWHHSTTNKKEVTLYCELGNCFRTNQRDNSQMDFQVYLFSAPSCIWEFVKLTGIER